MLRVGGHWWRRTHKKVWYDDGEFGATQFTPSHVWDLTYRRGPKEVVMEYAEETWD